jgi:molecular chaperone DnaK
MQTSVEVHVVQGEREFARDNKSLGQFVLSDMPPAPRGIPQIVVSFELDSNGILNVSAKDKASGKTQKITITASTNLSTGDVDKMVKDADAFAAEDKKRREEVEVKNQADSLIYQTDKTIKEFGDKVPEESKAKVDAAKEALKTVAEADPFKLEEVKAKMEDLQKAIMDVSSSLYGQGEGEGEGEQSAEASNGPVEGEVVDAEYEVKN